MGFKFEKLSVLVAEDTMPLRKLLVSVLDTMGVGKIFTASDGADAYRIFTEQNPDIVITDWHMQPVSGMELVNNIRKNPKSPNKMVPIILMSGYTAMTRVAVARDEGATEFLVKPFTAQDLAMRIAYVITKPRDFVDSSDYFGPDRRRGRRKTYAGPERREKENR